MIKKLMIPIILTGQKYNHTKWLKGKIREDINKIKALIKIIYIAILVKWTSKEFRRIIIIMILSRIISKRISIRELQH